MRMRPGKVMLAGAAGAAALSVLSFFWLPAIWGGIKSNCR